MDNGLNHYDRFRMDALTDFQLVLRAEADSLESRIAELVRGATMYTPTHGGEPRIDPKAPLRLRMENPSCAGVAHVLLDLDLELRRASAFMAYGRTRPAAESRIVEVASALRSPLVDVTLEVGGEIYVALTSRPIAFLQVLDWFWLHRQTRSRVRPPYETLDPMLAWTEMLRTASNLAPRGNPVVVTVEVAADGTTKFSFASYSSEDVDGGGYE